MYIVSQIDCWKIGPKEHTSDDIQFKDYIINIASTVCNPSIKRPLIRNISTLTINYKTEDYYTKAPDVLLHRAIKAPTVRVPLYHPKVYIHV